MPKPVLILELRKRVNQNANETIDTIGVFTSRKKLLSWIKENPTYAKDYGFPKAFYAVLQTDPNTDAIFFSEALDSNGQPTYTFKRTA